MAGRRHPPPHTAIFGIAGGGSEPKCIQWALQWARRMGLRSTARTSANTNLLTKGALSITHMHPLLWPFWNATERRLRAGWRILIHLAAYLYAPPLLNRVVGDGMSRWIATTAPDLATLSDRLALAGLRLLVVVLSTWLIVRYLDRRPWADMGMRMNGHWWRDLLFGLLLGALLMSVVFGVELAAGWVEIRAFLAVGTPGIPFAVAILGPAVVFVVIGITEELLARGYQLRNIAEGIRFPAVSARVAIVISWVISSSLFGLLHIFNPNATWISTLYLMLAGLFLGLGYILLGRLGLPIGLHITWNFFQGSVYGFPVSGNIFSSASFIAIEQHGPALWTGGAFGPEAGLIGIAAILLGCICIVVWVWMVEGRLAIYLPLAVYRPLPGRPPAGDAACPTGRSNPDSGGAPQNHMTPPGPDAGALASEERDQT